MIYRQKYRDRIDIICQVLEAASGDYTKKTRIMSKAFLSHSQLNRYLRVLTPGELISYDSGAQTYKTTEKGIRFLDIHNQMDEMIKVPTDLGSR